MNVGPEFVEIAGIICEPVRARILWSLLDGRAFTATELAVETDISASSASNHLSKLLDAGLLKVDRQGRHRYFSFARPEVAYAVEALANLADSRSRQKHSEPPPNGIRHCRTCYDHLAGFVAVRVLEAMERHKIVSADGPAYAVTKKGWDWFAAFSIVPSNFENNRRPLTRQCLDWSERRPHLAGQLGAKFLEKTLEQKWFRKVQFSRELIVTPKGRNEMNELFESNL